MLRFMKNKILLPILALSALAAFFSFKYTDNDAAAGGDQKKKMVLETVTRAITQDHFSPSPMDDSFSVKVYKKVLNTFDYNKQFFTQGDVDKLAKAFAKMQ